MKKEGNTFFRVKNVTYLNIKSHLVYSSYSNSINTTSDKENAEAVCDNPSTLHDRITSDKKRKDIPKLKTFKATGNLLKSGHQSRSIPRSDCVILVKPAWRNQRATSQTRPQLGCYMLRLMTVKLEKDWTNMLCWEGIPGESFFPLERPWQHRLGFQIFTKTINKTSGVMSSNRLDQSIDVCS